jgi:hypothetical protein
MSGTSSTDQIQLGSRIRDNLSCGSRPCRGPQESTAVILFCL